MSENKIYSADDLGSNLAVSDAHVIAPHEYTDIPELSDADLARGTWRVAGERVTEAQGKAAFSAAMKKQKISITLDPDVLGWYKQKSGGRGYQTLINATLRHGMLSQTIEDTVRKVMREEMQH